MSARLPRYSSALVLALCLFPALHSGLRAQTFGEPEAHLPQVVFGDGSRTLIAVHNPNQDELLIFRRFFASDGSPDPFENFTVQPLGTTVFELPSDDPLRVGRMEFSADFPFVVTAFITLQIGGQDRPTVGAQAGPLTDHTRFFGFTQNGTRSGMAVANPESTATTVSVRLFNSAGLLIRSTQFQMSGFTQRALFLDELFDNLVSFQGVVDVRAMPTPVSLLSLTQDAEGNISTVATVFPNDP